MGDRHLYPAPSLDDSPRNGLLCFLNADRVCGADCASYSPEPGGGPSLSEEQRHCVLLCSAERLGRHSGLIARSVGELAELAKAHLGGETCEPK